MLRRDDWYELGDGYVLAIDKWTGDAESLATALKETGWFDSARDMHAALDLAVFEHVWIGTDDDGDPAVCSEEGTMADGSSSTGSHPATIVDVGACMP